MRKIVDRGNRTLSSDLPEVGTELIILGDLSQNQSFQDMIQNLYRNVELKNKQLTITHCQSEGSESNKNLPFWVSFHFYSHPFNRFLSLADLVNLSGFKNFKSTNAYKCG